MLKGRCLPYGEAITYWPLAEILKTYTGVLDSDPPEAGAREDRRARRGRPRRACPIPRVPPAVLAFTFGLEDAALRAGRAPAAPGAARDPRGLAGVLHRSRPRTVRRSSSIEDIHWADDPLLDLLEELADRVAGPLLFVCPSRPDLAQRRTGWGGGKRNFSSIFLEPLSHDDAATLVDVLLAVDDLPDETREAMLARADGNPLFLEEIIRHLIDEGRIVRDGGRWRATEDIDEIVIPDTVQAVLAARIDLLPAVERSALLSASVVGRVFWNGSVAQLLDDGNERRTTRSGGSRTASSCSRSSGRESPASASSSSSTFSRATWRTARSPAATALARTRTSPRGSSRPPGSGSASSPTCSRTTSASRTRARSRIPASPADRRDELRLRSLAAALAASAEARSRMLLDKANAFAEAALGVAADAHERSLALEALGLCALWDYRGDDAWRNLSQAVDERFAGGSRSGEALAMLCARAVESPTRWPASMARSRPKRLRSRAMSRSASSTRRPKARHGCVCSSRAGLWVFAFRREGFTDDEAEAARRAGEEAFALAEALGRDDLASAALDGVESIEFILGLHGRTWPVVERRLAIVERLTDPWEVGDAFQTAADTALAIGRYEDARRWASEGYERARGGPDVWRAGLAWRAIARFKLGDWDGALEDFERMEARARRDALRNDRVLHADDVELHRAAPRASWRARRSRPAGRARRGGARRRHADGPEDPVARAAAAHRGSDEALERIEESASIARPGDGDGRDPRGALRRDRASSGGGSSRTRRSPTHGRSPIGRCSRRSRSMPIASRAGPPLPGGDAARPSSY